MSARQLPTLTDSEQMRQAACMRGRVRVRGVVVEVSDAYNSSYRQHALLIHSTAGLLRVTASTTSRLGLLPLGTTVDLAAQLTGLVDLSSGTYHGKNAHLLGTELATIQPA